MTGPQICLHGVEEVWNHQHAKLTPQGFLEFIARSLTTKMNLMKIGRIY